MNILLATNSDYPEPLEDTAWATTCRLHDVDHFRFLRTAEGLVRDEFRVASSIVERATYADWVVGHRELISLLPALRLIGDVPKVALIPDVNMFRPRDLFDLCLAAQVKSTEDIVFSGSSAAATPYVEFGFRAEPLYPLGIPTKVFVSRPELRLSIRRRYGLPETIPALIYTGRLRDKGVPDLLRVFKAVLHARKATLILCLRYFEPQLMREYAKAAQLTQDEIASIYIYPDAAIEVITELLNASNIYISLALSADETFGRAVVEAMSVGLPIIAWRYSGHKETVNRESGVLVKVTNPYISAGQNITNFVEHTINLLANPDRIRALGHGAICSAKKYDCTHAQMAFLSTLDRCQAEMQEKKYDRFRTAGLPEVLIPIFRGCDEVSLTDILLDKPQYFAKCDWSYHHQARDWWFSNFF